MTTEKYLMLTKNIHMNIFELEHMTVGGIIDYADIYADELDRARSKKPKERIRKANQSDIDAL